MNDPDKSQDDVELLIGLVVIDIEAIRDKVNTAPVRSWYSSSVDEVFIWKEFLSTFPFSESLEMDSLSGVKLMKADGSSQPAEAALDGKVGRWWWCTSGDGDSAREYRWQKWLYPHFQKWWLVGSQRCNAVHCPRTWSSTTSPPTGVLLAGNSLPCWRTSMRYKQIDNNFVVE